MEISSELFDGVKFLIRKHNIKMKHVLNISETHLIQMLLCKRQTFFIVYCKLQSTQLDRVISKSEVKKGREAGTIHRWFTGVVLLD